MIFRAFLVVLLVLVGLAHGETNTPVTSLPNLTPNVQSYDRMRTFLREEDAQRQAELFPFDVVPSGGIHATAAGMTSAAFATTAYTNHGNRVVQAAASINYSAMGCANTSIAWVVISSGTTSPLGTFVRVAGTQYYVDCTTGSGRPPQPADTAWLMRVTLTSGAITNVESLRRLTMLQVSVGSPDTTGCLSVVDFGGNPDDDTDDTQAFLDAVATIKGDTGTYAVNKGTGCLFLPLPTVVGKHYRISQDIDWSNKFNIRIVAPALLAWDLNAVADKTALIKWYGGTGGHPFLFHSNFGVVLENISIDCRGIAGTSGIALGKDATTPSSVRNFAGDHLSVRNCNKGIRVGDLINNGPDIAYVTLRDTTLEGNLSTGLHITSGNAVVQATSLWAVGNGSAPAGGAQGSNIENQGGDLYLTNYVGLGGDGGSARPAVADIYNTGGVHIYGARSEVTRPFLIGSGGSNFESVVLGAKHFSGNFTDPTVPQSVIWSAASPLTIAGLFFNDIQVNTGNNSIVNDIGVRFYVGSPHTTNVAKFSGSAITQTFAYVGFPHGAQHGRVALGQPPRTDIGESVALSPYLWVTAPNLSSHDARCAIDVNGNGCMTQSYHYSVAESDWLGNAYRKTNGDFVSIQSGRMSRLAVLGTTPGLLIVQTDNATAAGQTKFTSAENILTVSVPTSGVSNEYAAQIGTRTISWGTAAPTTGSFIRGSIFFNQGATSGQPMGWICVTATCTAVGHWTPMPNVP